MYYLYASRPVARNRESVVNLPDSSSTVSATSTGSRRDHSPAVATSGELGPAIDQIDDEQPQHYQEQGVRIRLVETQRPISYEQSTSRSLPPALISPSGGPRALLDADSIRALDRNSNEAACDASIFDHSFLSLDVTLPDLSSAVTSSHAWEIADRAPHYQYPLAQVESTVANYELLQTPVASSPLEVEQSPFQNDARTRITLGSPSKSIHHQDDSISVHSWNPYSLFRSLRSENRGLANTDRATAGLAPVVASPSAPRPRLLQHQKSHSTSTLELSRHRGALSELPSSRALRDATNANDTAARKPAPTARHHTASPGNEPRQSRHRRGWNFSLFQKLRKRRIKSISSRNGVLAGMEPPQLPDLDGVVSSEANMVGQPYNPMHKTKASVVQSRESATRTVVATTSSAGATRSHPEHYRDSTRGSGSDNTRPTSPMHVDNEHWHVIKQLPASQRTRDSRHHSHQQSRETGNYKQDSAPKRGEHSKEKIVSVKAVEGSSPCKESHVYVEAVKPASTAMISNAGTTETITKAKRSTQGATSGNSTVSIPQPRSLLRSQSDSLAVAVPVQRYAQPYLNVAGQSNDIVNASTNIDAHIDKHRSAQQHTKQTAQEWVLPGKTEDSNNPFARHNLLKNSENQDENGLWSHVRPDRSQRPGTAWVEGHAVQSDGVTNSDGNLAITEEYGNSAKMQTTTASLTMTPSKNDQAMKPLAWVASNSASSFDSSAALTEERDQVPPMPMIRPVQYRAATLGSNLCNTMDNSATGFYDLGGLVAVGVPFDLATVQDEGDDNDNDGNDMPDKMQNDDQGVLESEYAEEWIDSGTLKAAHGSTMESSCHDLNGIQQQPAGESTGSNDPFQRPWRSLEGSHTTLGATSESISSSSTWEGMAAYLKPTEKRSSMDQLRQWRRRQTGTSSSTSSAANSEECSSWTTTRREQQNVRKLDDMVPPQITRRTSRGIDVSSSDHLQPVTTRISDNTRFRGREQAIWAESSFESAPNYGTTSNPGLGRRTSGASGRQFRYGQPADEDFSPRPLKSTASTATYQTYDNSVPSLSSNICQCCFEDVTPMDRTSTFCSSETSNHHHHSHQFCTNCTRRYVEEFVFGGASYPLRTTSDGKMVLPCFSISDACSGYLSEGLIRHAVSGKVWSHYQDRIQAAHLRHSNRRCQDALLRVESSTGQAASDTKADTIHKSVATIMEMGYHDAEEAMTEAKIRRCPNCAAQFLKESGYCNKMRCPCCYTCMCYICRHEVPDEGYSHFCVHSYDHCSRCTKCPLWTRKDDAQDRARLREVASDVANRVWEASLLLPPSPPSEELSWNNPSTIGGTRGSGSEVRLDLDRLLQEPK